jgi:hypothetical protein
MVTVCTQLKTLWSKEMKVFIIVIALFSSKLTVARQIVDNNLTIGTGTSSEVKINAKGAFPLSGGGVQEDVVRSLVFDFIRNRWYQDIGGSLGLRLVGTADINDDVTTPDLTWSSTRIDDEIQGLIKDDMNSENVNSEKHTWSIKKIEGLVFDASGSSIDDSVTSSNKTWSSEKISEEISVIIGDSIEYDFVYDDPDLQKKKTWSIKRTYEEIRKLIEDDQEVSNATWSSTKIKQEIDDNIPELDKGELLSSNGDGYKVFPKCADGEGIIWDIGSNLGFKCGSVGIINDETVSAGSIWSSQRTAGAIESSAFDILLKLDVATSNGDIVVFSDNQYQRFPRCADGEIIEYDINAPLNIKCSPKLDINSFVLKEEVNENDILAIEDSEDEFKKKKVKIADIPYSLLIKDDEIELEKTWSSSKINTEISGLIDDSISDTDKTWSSSKINTEISGLIDDSTLNTDKTWSSSKIGNMLSDLENSSGATISDTTTANNTTWSSSKINTEISGLIDDFSISSSKVFSSQETKNQIDQKINDGIVDTSTTWSSFKIDSEISGLIDDSTPSLDSVFSSQQTLSEIQALISDASTSATTVWSSQETKNQIDQKLNDGLISTNFTWSSSKINTEILGLIDDMQVSSSKVFSSQKTKNQIDQKINDGIVDTSTTWSSSKINTEISAISGSGVVIDDLTTSTTKTWSSSKIGSEISNASININTLPEKTVLNGNDVFIIEDSQASNTKKKVKASNITSNSSSFNPLDKVLLFSDFTGQIFLDSSSPYNYMEPFYATMSGTNARIQSGFQNLQGFFGYVDVYTGSSTSGYSSLSTYNVILNTGSPSAKYKTRLALSNLSTVSEAYTLTLGVTSNPTDGSGQGFRFTYTHNVNSGRWRCTTQNSISTTNVDSGFVTSTGAVTLEIDYTPTLVSFFIGGNLVCSIATNIPVFVDTSMRPIALIRKNAGNSDRYMLLDFLYFEMDANFR